MRTAKLNSLAGLSPIANGCTNPNSDAASLLRNQHVDATPTQVSNLETSPDKVLDAHDGDQSLLAQYLLYRF